MLCACNCGREFTPTRKGRQIYYSNACKARVQSRKLREKYPTPSKKFYSGKYAAEMPGYREAKCSDCQMSGLRFAQTHITTNWLGEMLEACPYRPKTRSATIAPAIQGRADTAR